MSHEYRESPGVTGYCAGCGHPYHLCQGVKRFDLSFLKERPEFAPDAQAWDRWCARYGVDPNTPDERAIDDFLHGRIPPLMGYDAKPIESNATGGDRLFVTTPWDALSFYPSPSLYRFPIARNSQVNLKWRDDAQREWYAACEAFSAAYARFPLTTRQLQDRAEVVELERLYHLSSSGQEPK